MDDVECRQGRCGTPAEWIVVHEADRNPITNHTFACSAHLCGAVTGFVTDRAALSVRVAHLFEQPARPDRGEDWQDGLVPGRARA